jgi:hypothetical protein
MRVPAAILLRPVADDGLILSTIGCIRRGHDAVGTVTMAIKTGSLKHKYSLW